MDPDKFKSTFSELAFGTALGAAARDYKKELLASSKQKADAAPEVDLDELLDDPELEKLHAERLASLKKEAEKRQVLERKGHGQYRELTEGEFLGEVTGTGKVVCHFFHRDFVRCKIVDKHLQALALKHFETKFLKMNVENCPFFVTKLKVKTLPCIIIFSDGFAYDRVVGFEELGSADDFPTSTLEKLLIKKGAINSFEKKPDEQDQRRVRSTTYNDDSDSG